MNNFWWLRIHRNIVDFPVNFPKSQRNLTSQATALSILKETKKLFTFKIL